MKMKFHGNDTSSLDMLRFIEENPLVAARDIVSMRGMHDAHVYRIIRRLHQRGLIHVGGYCDLKRHRAKLWVCGPGRDKPYPYVPKHVQDAGQRRREREHMERKRIRQAAQAGGAFGAMAAQLMRD